MVLEMEIPLKDKYDNMRVGGHFLVHFKYFMFLAQFETSPMLKAGPKVH